jgi:hypothetical protein
MRYTRRTLLIATVALTACASGTGILPAGPNTYTITETRAPVRGGGAEAERVALTEANDYCQQQGRIFVPNLLNQAGNLANSYGPTGYSVLSGASYRMILRSRRTI